MKARILLLALFFLVAVLTSAQTIINSPNHNAVIPNTYFGVHAWGFESGNTPWPQASIGAYRTWDSGAVWSSIEPSRGRFNWSQLDSIVSFMQSKHVDVLFTFGRTPQWASSRPHAACGGGSGQCAPPYSMQDLSNFASALASRYKGRIRYYEIWNEPNASNWWQGSTGQLVSVGKTVYSAIKNIDSGAQIVAPATQGLYAFRLADEYFGAGGPADIVSFHGYVGSSHGKTQAAEKWINVAQNMFAMMNRHGLHKPLWDTEIGWDFNYHLPNPYDQTAFISRLYVLHWLYGVNRMYWDMYDGTSGTLFNGHLTQAGQAYAVVSHWLVGSSMDQCAQYANGTWACHLVRSNGHNAWILWDVNGNSSFQPLTSWGLHAQFDLYGATHSISPTASVAISALPVMVEGGMGNRGSSGGSGGDSPNTDFTVTATPSSATVAAGQAAQFQLTVTPAAGFNQTATFACAGAPVGNTCTPSAPSLALNGKSPSTVQFSVTTSATPVSASLLPTATGLLFLVATILLLPIVLERNQLLPRRLRIAAAVGFAATLALMLASCGGSVDARNKQVTVVPSTSSYTLVLSATSGKVTHATTVKLQVR